MPVESACVREHEAALRPDECRKQNGRFKAHHGAWSKGIWVRRPRHGMVLGEETRGDSLVSLLCVRLAQLDEDRKRVAISSLLSLCHLHALPLYRLLPDGSCADLR